MSKKNKQKKNKSDKSKLGNKPLKNIRGAGGMKHGASCSCKQCCGE